MITCLTRGSASCSCLNSLYCLSDDDDDDDDDAYGFTAENVFWR